MPSPRAQPPTPSSIPPKRYRHRLAAALFALSAALLAGCSSAGRAPEAIGRGGAGFAAALARVVPFAVGVYCISLADEDGKGTVEPEDEATYARVGAGFLVDVQGFVVTAGHVVTDCDQIVVKLSDQRVLGAERVGLDADTDIALLRVPYDPPQPPPLGRSTALRPGHWVLAVGEPYGLNRSVSAGIVGGKDRHFGDDPELLFIQSDVALNPGNSGGPMVDSRGAIVGMNMRTVVGAYGAPGVSLSVPIEIVMAIVEDLRRDGVIARPRLGAEFNDLLPQVALRLGRVTTLGAVVSAVRPGSIAERMGLKVNDIVVAMNGRPIAHSADLARELLRWRRPQGAQLLVLRGGEVTPLRYAD